MDASYKKSIFWSKSIIFSKCSTSSFEWKVILVPKINDFVTKNSFFDTNGLYSISLIKMNVVSKIQQFWTFFDRKWTIYKLMYMSSYLRGNISENIFQKMGWSEYRNNNASYAFVPSSEFSLNSRNLNALCFLE